MEHIASVNDCDEPKLVAAPKSDEHELWLTAIKEEFDTIVRNKTRINTSKSGPGPSAEIFLSGVIIKIK